MRSHIKGSSSLDGGSCPCDNQQQEGCAEEECLSKLDG